MEDGEKIKNIIEKAKTFALIADKNCEEYKLLCREALKNILEKENKTVYLVPENPAEFLEKWSIAEILSEKNSPSHSVSIRIPKKNLKIKEISYEDSQDDLILNVISEEGGLNPNEIILEQKTAGVDAVFLFGSDLEVFGKFKIAMPPEDKIIKINNGEENLTEKIFAISKINPPTGGEIEGKTATLLLASLLLETKNFSQNIQEKTLSIGSALLEAGANKKIISEMSEREKTSSFAQLFGRALARTRINENLKSSWTFLTEEDFKKSGLEEKDNGLIHKIADKISDFLPVQPISFIFWQSENGVYCLVSANQNSRDILASMAENLNNKLEGKYFICGLFKNFSEAEITLQKTLKEYIK